jgi:uncharacterized protein (TIRG00374 family)
VIFPSESPSDASVAPPAKKTRLRKGLLLAGKILVSGVCILYVLHAIDIPAFVGTLTSAIWQWFLLALVLLLIGQIVNAVRWAVLSRPLGLPGGWADYIKLYFVGAFFNAFLPGVIGGDVVKAYYLSRDTRQVARPMTSVFMDRNVGVGGLLSVGCVSSLLHPVSLGETPLTPILVTLLAGYVLLNWAILSPRVHRFTIGVLDRIGLAFFSKRLHNLFEAFGVYRHCPRRVGLMLMLAAGVHLFSYVAIFFIGKSLGAQVPLHYYLVFIPVIAIISMLPISVGGLGVRETAFLTLFGSVGLPAEQSVSLGLLWYVIVLLIGVPGIVFYLRGRR